MARKAQLTESLPKLAVSSELRARVEAVANAAEVSMADVERDCLLATLPTMELQLGLVDLDDLEEDQLKELGLAPRPAPPALENRAANCFGAAR